MSNGVGRRFGALVSIRSLLKLGDYGLTVGAACYVAGFIVHSFYLGEFSVVRFDILRTKYILSGALFLAFAGPLFFGVYRAWQFIRPPQGEKRTTTEGDQPLVEDAEDLFGSQPPDERPPRAVIGRLVSETLVLAILVYLFYLAVSHIPGSEEWWLTTNVTAEGVIEIADTSALFGRPIVAYLFVTLAPYVAILVLYLLLLVTHTLQAVDIEGLTKKVLDRLGHLMVVVVLATFVLAIWYSDNVYGDIPQQIGGGKTIPVVDVVVDNQRFETELRSGRYRLIHILDRTPDSVIFLLFTERGERIAVEVANDQIVSIEYGIRLGDDSAPAVCAVDPRPVEDLEALFAAPPAPPPGPLPDLPRYALPEEAPRPVTLPEGTPADPATLEAINATMQAAAACLNAGDVLGFLAFFTDELLQAAVAGGRLPPEIMPSLSAPPVAAPPGTEKVFFPVDEARVLSDGRVLILVDNVDAAEPPFGLGKDLVVFVQVGDLWLIDAWIENVAVSGEATPESA